jgi:uncharacterized protein
MSAYGYEQPKPLDTGPISFHQNSNCNISPNFSNNVQTERLEEASMADTSIMEQSTRSATENAINWFEIPVNDIERAMKFYGAVFATQLQKRDVGTSVMAFLPDHGGVGGAIVQVHDKTWGYAPSHSGSVVYLNGGEDLSTALSRVEGAGGKVITPKTDIGQGFGYFAFFEDTEGNRVGLHSMK